MCVSLLDLCVSPIWSKLVSIGHFVLFWRFAPFLRVIPCHPCAGATRSKMVQTCIRASICVQNGYKKVCTLLDLCASSLRIRRTPVMVRRKRGTAYNQRDKPTWLCVSEKRCTRSATKFAWISLKGTKMPNLGRNLGFAKNEENRSILTKFDQFDEKMCKIVSKMCEKRLKKKF